MRGTWQGSGTWQSGGGLVVPVVIAAVAVAVAEFVLSIIMWLAIAAGIVLVLAAAGLIWWLRGAPKRKAAYAAAYAAAFEAQRRPATVTATVIPPAMPPVVNFNFYAAGSPEPARVIRTVIPGTAGDAITEGN
jgi:hypothetical protein